MAESGFADPACLRYTPAEMKAQVDSELQTASPLATFRYELDLFNAHGVLAENGCGFLVVHAHDDEKAERVAAVARPSRCQSIKC